MQQKNAHKARGPRKVSLGNLATKEGRETNWNALDELIDAGVTSRPIKGFPARWLEPAAREAHKIFMDRAVTILRASELAISNAYHRRKYVPSHNAFLYPERAVAERLRALLAV